MQLRFLSSWGTWSQIVLLFVTRFYNTPTVRHEIAGTAVRVGSAVQGIKVGDRVGVGAMIASCYDCGLCKNDNENYCAKRIDTYGDKYPDGVVRLISNVSPC